MPGLPRTFTISRRPLAPADSGTCCVVRPCRAAWHAPKTPNAIVNRVPAGIEPASSLARGWWCHSTFGTDSVLSCPIFDASVVSLGEEAHLIFYHLFVRILRPGRLRETVVGSRTPADVGTSAGHRIWAFTSCTSSLARVQRTDTHSASTVPLATEDSNLDSPDSESGMLPVTPAANGRELPPGATRIPD